MMIENTVIRSWYHAIYIYIYIDRKIYIYLNKEGEDRWEFQINQWLMKNHKTSTENRDYKKTKFQSVYVLILTKLEILEKKKLPDTWKIY